MEFEFHKKKEGKWIFSLGKKKKKDRNKIFARVLNESKENSITSPLSFCVRPTLLLNANSIFG